MKEKRFNVGDRVTFKSLDECGGRYRFGGDDRDGFKTSIIQHLIYREDDGSWEVVVESKGGNNYTMLESEFREYDEPVRSTIVSNPAIGDKVVRGRDWDWGGQDEGSIYGRVSELKGDWCRVEWINKHGLVVNEDSYRCGSSDKYDLYYYFGEEVQQKTEMEKIQEECKRLYPIGCSFFPVGDSHTTILKMDEVTYEINERNRAIYAHNGAGCLYLDGQWATLAVDTLTGTSAVVSGTIGMSSISTTTGIINEMSPSIAQMEKAKSEWERIYHKEQVSGTPLVLKHPLKHQKPVLRITKTKSTKLVIK